MYHRDTFEQQALALRGIICDYLERGLCTYDWLRKIRDTLIPDTPEHPRDQHVTRMREDGEYATDLEIVGFMLMLKVRVTVVIMSPEKVPFVCHCPLRTALVGHKEIASTPIVNALLSDTHLKELYVCVCVGVFRALFVSFIRAEWGWREINLNTICTHLSCVVMSPLPDWMVWCCRPNRPLSSKL